MRLSDHLVDRYLTLLGVPRRQPGRQALDELVGAHLTRVPFENVSKLHWFKQLGLTDLPPIELFLDGIEQHRFGGTCYANNCHLWELLVELGYQARLCGADMNAPDVHVVIMVTVDGQDLLVDVGYAAPFPVALPLDLDQDLELRWGEGSYLLRPRDRDGRARVDLVRSGQVVHGYLARPVPRTPEHFRPQIADSLRPQAMFRNVLLICRFEPDRYRAIRNLNLIEITRDGVSRQPLRNVDEVVALAHEEFGLPAGIVAEVLAGMPLAGDPLG